MTSRTCVWLYGSYARGDADKMSDKDFLLIGDAPNSPELAAFDDLGLRDGSVSQYSWSEIRNMASHGSLFLEHLKLEGVVVYESPECRGVLRNLLKDLPRYVRGERDVQAFVTVLKDVREELLAGSPISYELGVLGTVIRHASILGCYILGSPCFGRTEPVRRISKFCNLPSDFSNAFSELYRYRLACEGRACDSPMSNLYSEQQWLDWAEYLIHFVGDLSHERNRHLPAAGSEN